MEMVCLNLFRGSENAKLYGNFDIADPHKDFLFLLGEGVEGGGYSQALYNKLDIFLLNCMARRMIILEQIV